MSEFAWIESTFVTPLVIKQQADWQTGLELLGISLASCEVFWRVGKHAVEYASGCTRNAGQSREKCVSLRQTLQWVIDLVLPVKHSLYRSPSLIPQSSDFVLAAFRQ